MTPKAAVWAVWGVVRLCASDWLARALIRECLRGTEAPVASRDAKLNKFGGFVYNFRPPICQIGPIIRSELTPQRVNWYPSRDEGRGAFYTKFVQL